MNGITYQNLDNNYLKISNFLNKSQINYINSIKNIEAQESIKFTVKETSLDIKYLSNQIKLKYFDGFEIIDTRFATFLKNKFNNIIMYSINFVAINNKFLTVINQEEQNYYEIISLDSNNNFTFECLLQIVVNNIYRDKNSLNAYIFHFLSKNKLNNLISHEKISLENNNFVFDLYFKDYININQIKNNEDNLSQSVKSGKNFLDKESSITTFEQTSNNGKNLLTF